MPGKTVFKAATVFPAVSAPSWELFSFHCKNTFERLNKYWASSVHSGISDPKLENFLECVI